jgi:hypothetical protein
MKKVVGLMLVLFLAACSSAPKVDVGSSGVSAGSSGSTGLGGDQNTETGKGKISYSNDPGWKVIFSETFDDNSQNWDLKPYDGKYVSYEASIADGVYNETISGKPAGNYLNAGIHTVKLGEATDFYVGVTGMIDSKFKNSSMGIGFLADDDLEAYVNFGMLKDSYSLYRHNVEALIKDNVLESKVTGRIEIGKMNTLELKKDGNILEYFINGKAIGKYNLSEIKYPGKNVYLFLLVDEGAKATFTIDNILMQSK